MHYGLCGWLVFGLLAGAVARFLMPGTQRMGLIMTSLLGIGGSFVGGMIASMIYRGNPFVFTPAGFIGSVIGALVLLFIGSRMK